MKLILKKVNPHYTDEVYCQEVLDEYYTGPVPSEGQDICGHETDGTVKSVSWNFAAREIVITII